MDTPDSCSRYCCKTLHAFPHKVCILLVLQYGHSVIPGVSRRCAYFIEAGDSTTHAHHPPTIPQHFVYEDQIIETGASIIYTGNAHLFNLTERVNLKRVDLPKQEGPNTGLWDGKRFVLTTTDWGLANLLRMAWRYGM